MRMWLPLILIAGCEAGTLDDDDDNLIDESELLETPNLPPGGGELAVAAGDTASTCSITVNTGKELMIRSLAIVEDPVRTKWTGSLSNPNDGAWHFGRLMTNMAGSQDPPTFVLKFLQRWAADRTVNGQVVAARPAIQQIINAWPKRADGKLDLTKSPMRLLAIVNRIDLRGDLNDGLGGEGRFVFGVLAPDGGPLSFTVILEYQLLAWTPEELKSWANEWHALGALTQTTEEYKVQLQKVTDRFTKKNADPFRPNGSAISQVRTNEVHLSFPWELREFRLSASTGQLAQVTVARTPRDGLNGTTVLRDFINQNESAILAGTHGVPLSFAGQPFRGGASENNIDFWNAPGIRSARARHLFSLNTCDGCHGAETNTAFLQINPRAKGQVSSLSGFLTGVTVLDPVNGQSRTFNDLGRRNTDFKNLLCSL